MLQGIAVFFLVWIGGMLIYAAYLGLTWNPDAEEWARIRAIRAKKDAKKQARRQRKTKPEPAMLTCEAPSPDNQLTCDLDIGHWGWHRNAETEWFGDAWDIDHWADTQQRAHVDPEPTMSAEGWPFGPHPAPPGYTPKPKPKPRTQEESDAFYNRFEAWYATQKKTTIGPEPLEFDIGMFGTRRPRKSA